MKVYSKKIETDVLHFVQLPSGRDLEGWGIEGISDMLEEMIEGPYGYDFMRSGMIVEFYQNICPRMESGDELTVTLAVNDVKDIRLISKGDTHFYPNLFLYHES